MSTTFIYGKAVFECDRCSDDIAPDESEFAEALAHIKREGWLAFKIADIWSHHCPICKGVAHERDQYRFRANRVPYR